MKRRTLIKERNTASVKIDINGPAKPDCYPHREIAGLLGIMNNMSPNLLSASYLKAENEQLKQALEGVAGEKEEMQRREL